MPSKKTHVWVVQGHYGPHGWEDLDEVTTRQGGSKEAQRLRAEYQIAAPYGQHRVIRRDR